MTTPFSLPDPVVELTEIHELADDLVVIGDRRVELVPNVGIVSGRGSADRYRHGSDQCRNRARSPPNSPGVVGLI